MASENSSSYWSDSQGRFSDNSNTDERQNYFPIWLKCEDSLDPCPVDRNVMLAASPFLNQLVQEKPSSTQVIPVPILSGILKLIIKAVYNKTSSGPLTSISIKLDRKHPTWEPKLHPVEDLFPVSTLHIEYNDVPGLIFASEFFELAELSERLRTFFFRNMEACFDNNSFLMDPYLNRAALCIQQMSTSADQQKRTLLANSSSGCAKRRSAGNSSEIENNFETRTRFHSKTASTTEGRKTRVIIANEKEWRCFGEGNICEKTLSSTLRGLFENNNWVNPFSSPLLIRRNRFYITLARDLLIFDLELGILRQTYKNAFRSADSMKTLVLWKGRLYCSDDSTISEVKATCLRPIYVSKLDAILRFVVLNHTGNTFEFCYTTASKNPCMYRTICDVEGAIIDEKRIMGKYMPIGTDDEGYTFMWDYENMLLTVKKAGTNVLLYRMNEVAYDFAHSGPEVYIMFRDHVLMVNTTNSSVKRIQLETPCSRLLIWEV